MNIEPHYREDILQFFVRVRQGLRSYEKEHPGKPAAIRFDYKRLMDLDWPPRHVWREEAPDSGTREEFLIRYARSVGLHASDDLIVGQLRCCLTRDVEHEARITWPRTAR